MSSEDHELEQSDLGFAYRIAKDGQVFVTWNGRQVTNLRGPDAKKFLARIEHANLAEAQQIMARVTGNFKRGNERTAGKHNRNRS
jgi:hypothetical protein